MPRPSIDWKLTAQIENIHDRHPNLTAREIRNFLKPPEGHPLPSLSVIYKYLRESNETRKKLALEDKPWSVTAMADYDVSPEALPAILKLWSRIASLSIREKDPTLLTQMMTIRIARWVARLYPVFIKEHMPLSTEELEKIPESERTNPDLWLDGLYLYALIYASLERVVKLVKYPTAYDDILMLWRVDAQLVGNTDLGKELEGNSGGEGNAFKLSLDPKFLRSIAHNLGPSLDIWERFMKASSRGKRKRGVKHERKHNAKK